MFLDSPTTLLLTVGWLACVCGWHGFADEPAFPAGEETELPWAQLTDPIRVYVPRAYEEKGTNTWPVVFFYHGTNGRPRTDYIRQFTDDQFIVVAMAYRERGLLVLNGVAHMVARAKEMTDRLEAVLRHVSAHLRMDRKRLVCSGLSKGGWTVSLISNTRPGAFAGLCMLMGGRQKFIDTPRDAARFGGKHVFIGVGEQDNNYIYSRLAESFYKRYKAKVVFEGYEGLGHDLPMRMPTLNRWFDMLGPYRGADDVERGRIVEEAADWIAEALSELEALPNMLKRFQAVQAIVADPYFPIIPAERRKEVEGIARMLMAEYPEFRQYLTAENEFHDIIGKEMKIASLAQMKHVRDAYATLLRKPMSDSTKSLVQNAHDRCEKAYQDSLRATEEAKQRFLQGQPSRTVPVPSPFVRPAPRAVAPRLLR